QKAINRINELFKQIKSKRKLKQDLEGQIELKEVKLNNLEKSRKDKYDKATVKSVKRSKIYKQVNAEIQSLKEELDWLGAVTEFTDEIEDAEVKKMESIEEKIQVDKEIKDIKEELITTKKSKELLEKESRHSMHQPTGSDTTIPSQQSSKSVTKEETVETYIPLIVQIKKVAKNLLSSATTNILGTKVKNYADAAANALLKKILSPDDGNNEKFRLGDSPGRALLFDKDGNIDSNVAAAIALAIDEVMAMNSGSMEYNDDVIIGRIFGVDEEQVTPMMRRAAATAGRHRRFMAHELGTAILNNLAIGPNQTESDYRLYEKLRVDMGQMALLYAEQVGYIEPLSETNIASELVNEIIRIRDGKKPGEGKEGDENIPTVKLSEKYRKHKDGTKNKLIEKIKANYIELSESLGIEENVKHYRTSERDKDRVHEVRNQPMADVAPEMQKTANVLENTSFTVNVEGVKMLMSVGREKILKLMGHTELTTHDNGDVTYVVKKDGKEETRLATDDDVESITARNNQLAKSYDELVELSETVSDSKIYYDWFISKNGRFFIDSAMTNPQTEKILHRFLINVEGSQSDIDMSKELHRMAFSYSIAQSMGYDIDKNHHDDIMAFAKDVMDNADIESMKKMLEGEEYTGEQKIEIEHLGHFVQGIQAIEAYRARDGGTFSTNISFETDAVTSAFAIKLLQFPIFKNLKRWAAKTGLFFKPNKDDGDIGFEYNAIDSMNNAIANGIVDSYKTLAAEVKITANTLNVDEEASDKVQARAERDKKLFNMMSRLLPEVFEKDIEGAVTDMVTKAAREMFKYPFMTFNYAAGMQTISKNLAKTLLEDVPNKILNGEMDEEVKQLIKDANQDAIENQPDLNKTMSDEQVDAELARIKKELKKKSVDQVRLFGTFDKGRMNPLLMDRMSKLVITVYGEAVREVMEDNFSELVDANEKVSNSFRFMFRAYNLMYNKRIAEIMKAKGRITLEDKKKLLKELRKYFPIIKAPFSDTEYDDGVAINDSTLQDVRGKGFTAKTHYVDKDGKGHTLTAAAI
ncbi:MAG: hypothetical protein U9N61_06630, partial [Euryarchaeota archaeon]|nr:hypothetical protein [Euryarchaeota archaeon]